MKTAILLPEIAMPSLGARYISSSLKAAGHDCHLLFLPRYFDDFETPDELDQIVNWVKEIDADILGISLMSHLRDRSIKLTDHLRNKLKLPVIWGGAHASLAPESCLDYADAVCVGEGEEVMVNLAENLESGKGFLDIPGIWSRNNTAIQKNNPPERNADLDSLPFPDYGFDGHAIIHKGKLRPLKEEWMRHYIYNCNGTHFTMTSRGCPGACRYCCNQKLKSLAPGAWLRKRKPESIITELKSILEQYQCIDSFAFWDDSFLCCTDEWLETFCSLYRKEINLRFFCNMHPREVTPERVQLLVDTGLVGIQMGLQTACDRVNREIYNRSATAEEFLHASNILHGFKDKILNRHYHAIVDNPYEKEDETAESVRLLSKIRHSFFLSRCALTYYPGTDIHDQALQDGIISEQSNPVYNREYFKHDRNYLNLLIRLTPVIHSSITRFFLNFRKSPPVRWLFYLFYYGFFTPRYRYLNQWYLNYRRNKLFPLAPRSKAARKKLLEEAIRFRAL